MSSLWLCITEFCGLEFLESHMIKKLNGKDHKMKMNIENEEGKVAEQE
jgi:hypothetical protein